MTIRNYACLQTTAYNLVQEARHKGLSPTKAIRLRLLGSTVTGDLITPERMVIVSYAQPLVSQYEIELWVNPLNKQVFRSDAASNSWTMLKMYQDMFSNVDTFASGSSGSGSTSLSQPVQSMSDLLSINTTTVPDKTMIYVESEKAIYALDADSQEPTSPGILAPVAGPGRWYVISTKSGTLGDIDGGSF